MNYHSKPTTDAPPLFEALGIPDTDDSAAELTFCRTLIQAHLRQLKAGNLNSRAEEVINGIGKDIANELGRCWIKLGRR